MKQKENHYDEVIKGLFLGDMKAAKDNSFFRKHKIKAVVNCTSDVKNHFKCRDNIEYMRLPIEDSLNMKDLRKMLHYYLPAVFFIHKNLVLENKNVFVHCWQGIQRSASVVAVYLMTFHNMSKEDAYDYIIDARSQAFHNGESFNFDWSINNYSKKYLDHK
jgi:protein-tyrosine phosphatase